MQRYESLKHSVWECKYHVVFIPKCRRKTLYGELRRALGPVFRSLAEQKECKVEEGHLMPDHVHMMLSVPPKYSVASVMGFIKGKERDPHSKGLRGKKAELCGAALLGKRVLGVDGRQERGGGASLHPGTREGRPTHRTTGAQGALSA